MNRIELQWMMEQAAQETGVAIDRWEKGLPGTIVVYARTSDANALDAISKALASYVPCEVGFAVKPAEAHPYRSPAPREEEPLPRMTGKALTDTAQRHGLDRKLGEDDDALRARLKAYIVPTWLSSPLPPGFEQQVQKMQEADELRARAKMLGVELDLGETIDGLRERVEAYLAGDERAKDPREWRVEKSRVKAQPWDVQSSDWTALGVAMNSAPKDGIVEVHAGEPVHIGAPVVRPSPEAIRAENRRVGEEIAANPPEWTYPIAWRLAVMAVVETYNNTKTVVSLDMRYWEQHVVPSLRAYHQARLDGLLPEPAMMKAVQEGVSVPLDKSFVVEVYDGIACQAYERGRPGPGGVRVGRSA